MTILKFRYLPIALFFAHPALAVTDPVTGLSVDPPAPFTAVLLQDRPQNVTAMVLISIPEEESVAARAMIGTTVACTVAARAAASNNSLTQAELDTYAVKPEIINLTKAQLGLLFDLGAPTVFTSHGATGLEFTGTFKGAQKAPVYITTVQTPFGVTMMNCSSPQARFEGLIPQFRLIRDAIEPAR